MNKLLQAFGFVVGAAVGSATTWYFTKRKYETIAQEEIDSVKKTYSERYAKKDKDEQNTNRLRKIKNYIPKYSIKTAIPGMQTWLRGQRKQKRKMKRRSMLRKDPM